MRRFLSATLVLVMCTLLTAISSGQPAKTKKSKPAKKEAKELYRELLPSTCWLVATTPDDPSSYDIGTGWVLNAQRRLIMTNDHVVEGHEQMMVFFPVEVDRTIVVDPQYYLKQTKPCTGVVIVSDADRDLAILQVERLPANANSVPLSDALPEPGDRVFTIAGLPRGSEGLWIMTVGTVRLSYRRSQARGAVTGIVETDLPYNKGNSGGPVINDSGQLVAVVEGSMIDARLVSMSIDVHEVKACLEEVEDLIAPQTAADYNDRGVRHHNAERYELALKDYAAALKLDPKLAMAHVNRGWVFAAREDHRTAVAEFDAALAIDAENASAYDGRGTAYRELGERDKAVADLTQAIRRAPDDASLYFRRGNTYFKDDQLDAALADLNRALDRETTDPDMWATRGQILRKLKRFEEAESDLRAAIRLDVGNFQWFYELGFVYYDAGNYQNAYNLYSMAAALNDQESRVFNNRGLTLSEMNRHTEALDDFFTAIKLNPQKPLYYQHAGNALAELDRCEQAIGFYTKAIELDPQDASLYRDRGDCYKKLGDSAAASADYQKAKMLE